MPGSEIDPAPPLDSRAANYEVVNRIRDLVKWLIIAFGAIAGVLLTGIQLSDLDKVHGGDRTAAIVAVVGGFLGVALVLGSAIVVLLPIDVIAGDLVTHRRIKKRVQKEPGLLAESTTIQDLLTVRKTVTKAEYEAWEAYRINPTDTTKESAFIKAKAVAERPNDAVQRLMSFMLAYKVNGRLRWAMLGFLGGGAMVAAGAIVFAIHTNQSDTSIGDVVPRRFSAVVVRLTPAGRDELASDLGRRCEATRLRAIVVGGPPDALRMTTVPSARCRAAHFTLEPKMGSAVTQKRLPSLRACGVPHPRMPCIVYPDSAALVAAGPE